jgi:hypothetical protein
LIVSLTLRRSVPSPAPAYVTDATLWIFSNGSVHGSRTPIATFASRTDSSGIFSVQVAGGLNDRYDFVAKPSGGLSRELNGVFVQRNVAEYLNFGPFDEGDADGDDDVDAADFALLKQAFATTSGQPNFDAKVDFNRDGRVTLLDFSLLARSYGLAGPRQE